MDQKLGKLTFFIGRSVGRFVSFVYFGGWIENIFKMRRLQTAGFWLKFRTVERQQIKLMTLLLLVAFFLSGCSVQSKLTRHYKDKSFSEVMAVMGAPTTIENLVGGGTLRSYVRKVMLKETPINTGQFQYDTFYSPKVMKNEITRFKVTQNGIVKEVSYSCEYTK